MDYEQYANQAIELIQKSIYEKMPLGQRNMSYYYDNKISYFTQSIEILEKLVKSLKKQKKYWTYNNNNNNNNNNVNISGGKRRMTYKKKK
jgi:hypothetical protein